MSGFYLLDVPEFAPFAKAAIATGECKEEAKVGCYRYFSFEDRLEIERAATTLPEAIWFGCLTAGLDGKIAQFDSNRLTLVATNEPIIPPV